MPSSGSVPRHTSTYSDASPSNQAKKYATVCASLTTGLDINKCTMKDVYYKFGLEAGTQDFVGHAMALWLDEE
jgi:RAB protein geranylgeranyltransferase component A